MDAYSRTPDMKLPNNQRMVWCPVCGYEHLDSVDCPACDEPAKYLPLEAIENLASEYGEDSAFAKALQASASKVMGRKGGSATSKAKKKSSAANGRKGGRPRVRK